MRCLSSFSVGDGYENICVVRTTNQASNVRDSNLKLSDSRRSIINIVHRSTGPLQRRPLSRSQMRILIICWIVSRMCVGVDEILEVGADDEKGMSRGCWIFVWAQMTSGPLSDWVLQRYSSAQLGRLADAAEAAQLQPAGDAGTSLVHRKTRWRLLSSTHS